MEGDFPTVTQKLNSRTLWVTAFALFAGLGIGVYFSAAWVPEAGKDLFALGMFSLGIMVGKSGK